MARNHHGFDEHAPKVRLYQLHKLLMIHQEAYYLSNYVGGAWVKPEAAEYVPVCNPATSGLLARTPLATTADVDAAVQAAAAAFPA
jgi:hypothetical protein